MILVNLKGITVLATLINEDFNNYYDWKNYQIRYDVIRNRMIKLRKDFRYSKKFIEILENILERDEFSRFGIAKLTEALGVNFYRESYTSGGDDNLDFYKKGGIVDVDYTKKLVNCIFYFKEKLRKSVLSSGLSMKSIKASPEKSGERRNMLRKKTHKTRDKSIRSQITQESKKPVEFGIQEANKSILVKKI